MSMMRDPSHKILIRDGKTVLIHAVIPTYAVDIQSILVPVDMRTRIDDAYRARFSIADGGSVSTHTVIDTLSIERITRGHFIRTVSVEFVVYRIGKDGLSRRDESTLRTLTVVFDDVLISDRLG